MMRGLVLSLFPGADLLGKAFEAEGWCVVRGPDVLLGGDIREWHVVPGRFDGIIGGPPCKAFSVAVTGQTPTQGNLIPEFVRIVQEAKPSWWVMENVPQSPTPVELGECHEHVVDGWCFGAAQHRTRKFCSNLVLEMEELPADQRHPNPWPCVTATEYKYCGSPRDKRRAGRKVGRQMTLAEINVAMGLPEDWETPALTKAMQYAVRGNGVPIQLGRAVARAVNKALSVEEQ